MELTIKASVSQPMMTREAARISTKMSAFQSRVLIRKKDMTVNAKSLMGLMSLEVADGESLTLLAKGPDEAEAVCMLSELLGA